MYEIQSIYTARYSPTTPIYPPIQSTTLICIKSYKLNKQLRSLVISVSLKRITISSNGIKY